MLTPDDRKKLLGWLLVHALVGTVVLSSVSRLAVTLAHTQRYRRSMAMRNLRAFRAALARGADVALLGNSYLARAVRRADLDNALAADGHRLAMLAQPSAVTPFWYLAIKHYVCRPPSRVRLVLLYIMETELTAMPASALSQEVMALLTDIDAQDSVLARMALRQALRERDFTDVLLLGLKFAWRGYGYRNSIRGPMFDALTGWPAALLRRQDPRRWPSYKEAVREVVQRHLTVREPVADRALDVSAERFGQQVQGSLFPEIERTCREHGVTLGIVRLKPNPAVVARRPRYWASIEEYMRHLADYCRARGIGFMDLSRDPHLDERCFARDHHMESAGRDYLTPVMAAHIREYLRAMPSARDRGSAQEPDS